MSLLSAHHVSQANALIHSAYLSSICLHYNHSGIIGFPLCSQIGTFISETYTAQGSALSYSLHLNCIHRQARRLHTAHTRATSSPLSTLGNKSCHCPPHGEVIKSTGRGGEGGGGGGKTGLRRQTASASNQIVLHCCVKFQMTSKDGFFPLA